uniref:Uncharacterized protein n=1 Tax=Oryza brachyantha TaxID=4533 RepID=J3NEM8_ORYBR
MRVGIREFLSWMEWRGEEAVAEWSGVEWGGERRTAMAQLRGGGGGGGGSGGVVGGDGRTGLLGSLVKEDGHVYSLAAAGELLYTGTDSKNVRVWRDRREFAGFRSGSGLVKAIVIAGDGRIYTGHQDGKVRVWRASVEDAAVHRRVGSLPRFGDLLKSAVNPSHYVETRRRHSAVWLRHFDAVSCLSLDADAGLLYSGSWDKTFKVWRVSDSRCLESVRAHDDAVNTVAAAGFDALVFTGSADGTVKVWRREQGKGGTTRHAMERVLRKGESAEKLYKSLCLREKEIEKLLVHLIFLTTNYNICNNLNCICFA